MGQIEYYNVDRTLSKQRLFNFVIGGRGMGKTYGCKEKGIKNFLKKHEQFVYIRRFDTDLQAAKIRNFFSDICDSFPGTDFKAMNSLFKINGDIAGWYFPLSTAANLKSIPFPDVTLIIFDEFIISDGVHHYIPGEVTAFLELYSTISRDRDVPVVFISNAITVTNPYFLYFDIAFEPGQTTKLTEFISVEFVRSETYEEHISSTKFGRMISGTEYGDYHIKNKFLLDTDTFISKLPACCMNLCTFIFNGRYIGMFLEQDTGMCYLSTKTDKTNKRIYTLEMKDHSQDTVMALRTNPFVRTLLSKYCDGMLRFTTQDVKNLCTVTLKKFI